MLVILVIAVFIGLSVSVNSKKFNQEDVKLSNIVALSTAQAENWDNPHCALVSTRLCWIVGNDLVRGYLIYL